MRAVLSGLVVLAVALMPPDATAQATATPVLTWELPEGTLAVEAANEVDYEATLHVACASGSVGSPNPWDIHVGVAPPEGFVVAYEPAVIHVVVDPVACASGEVLASEPVTLSIRVHDQVPAGTTTDIVLTATEASQEEPTAAPVPVEVMPFFNYQVHLDHAIHKVQPGGTVRLGVLGANFGNLDLLLKPSAGEGTSDALTPHWNDKWILPAGQEETFVVNVTTDAGGGLYENRRDSLMLRVDAVWSADPSVRGDTVSLAAVIQQQGSPTLEAPAPFAPALVLIALASLAAVRRR